MQISLILEDKSITCTEEIVPVNASLDTQERKTMSCAAGKWDTFPVEKLSGDRHVAIFCWVVRGQTQRSEEKTQTNKI